MKNTATAAAALLPIEREAFSPEEVCEALGISKPLLYEKIRLGEIEAKRFGGRRTIILRSELNRFLAALPSLELAKAV